MYWVALAGGGLSAAAQGRCLRRTRPLAEASNTERSQSPESQNVPECKTFPKSHLVNFPKLLLQLTTGTPTGVARCPHAAALLQRWRGGSDAAVVLRASHRSALCTTIAFK
jgi:hypothetical protein